MSEFLSVKCIFLRNIMPFVPAVVAVMGKVWCGYTERGGRKKRRQGI